MAKVTKKRQSKPALSRAKVLKKAVRFADKQGVGALSMRKLAQALNVEAMSLYNHVENKEDLLDGMVESVVLEFALPDTTKYWRVAIRESMISTHAVLLHHPWAAALLMSRVSMGDGMMTYSNACYGCLFEAGFSHALTDHGWNAINNHLYGFTLTELNSPVSTDDYAKAAAQYLPLVPIEEYPYIRSMMQVIIDGTHSGINDFEFGLDLLLEGLDNKLQSE